MSDRILDQPTAGRMPLIATLLATALLAFGLLVVTGLIASPVSAFPSGRVGSSGNPDTGGQTCASCHTGDLTPPSAVITGPTTLGAGETGMYTFTMTGGPAVVGGFNVSTGGSAGTLTPGAGSQLINSELTHSSAKDFVANSVSFDFSWTAPAAAGSSTMYAAGVSANGATGNQGDAVGATTLTVEVTAASTATCEGLAVTVNLANGDLPTDGPDVILGTEGDDAIGAGGGDDVICALGGDDQVWGQGGNDTIIGGDGNDRLRGGADNDIVRGGNGNDDVGGGTGDDQVFGDAGDDPVVRGNGGDDMVDGGTGNDALVNGNGGEDTVLGGDGNDKVVGGPRPDTVDGGAGNDEVRGLNGADDLRGGSGDDSLFGGKSPDTMDGGPGIDSCNGGTTGANSSGVVAFENDTAINCEPATNVP